MKKVILLCVFASLFFGIYWAVDTLIINPKLSLEKLDYVTQQTEFKSMPPFILETSQGGRFSSNNLKGKVSIIHFWASWCGPCLKEFPSLIKMAEANENILIAAISLDKNFKDTEAFMRRQKKTPENLVVLFDEESSVAKHYGSFKLPESYVFGPDQVLIKKIAGTKDWVSHNSKTELQDWQSL